MEKIRNFERAIVTLEFNKIREMLAAVCPTEGAKALAREVRPSRAIGTVRRMLAETDAAKTMQITKGMPPLAGIADVTAFVERADKGAVLLPAEILAVGRTLSAARSMVSGEARRRHSFHRGIMAPKPSKKRLPM